MTEKEIRDCITACIEQRMFCRVLFSFEYSYRNLLPVGMCDNLFISAVESGFRLDGFVIHRLSDLVSASSNKLLYTEAPAPEEDAVTDTDISSSCSLFSSLKLQKRNILIEAVKPDGSCAELITARVIGVSPGLCAVLRFAPGTGWAPVPESIGFRSIRRVTFGSRALEEASKYLPRFPLKI